MCFGEPGCSISKHCLVGFMLIVFAFVIVFVYILVFPELTDGVLCGASWLNLQALC